VLQVGSFWVREKSSEHINMRSSFEYLVVTSTTVKSDYKSDKRLELPNFLNFWISHLMEITLVFVLFFMSPHNAFK
jgi:hypothetical protein